MEKKHVQKLLSDIKDLLDGKTNSHFIGSVVYIITSEVFNQREWSIVDGQQRLTTIFLLLYAIRDILNDRGETGLAKALSTQYLENVNAQGAYKLRLKPLVSTDEAFQKIVESDFEDIDKTSLIYTNYSYIKQTIIEWLKDNDINNIVSAINKLYIVYIQLDKDDNPQQIFESINSTGETLKASDLIRNFILMNKVDKTQTLYYNNYWTKIEKNLENDSTKMEEFFRFFISIKKFDLISKSELYEQFVQYWSACIASGEVTEENILFDILSYSKYYAQLYLSLSIDGAERELNILKKIKSNMPAPLLMEFVRLYSDGSIDIKQLNECIKLVNTYLIRRHMCELDTSSITRLFPAVLKSVMNACCGKYANIVDVLKFYLVNQTRNKGSYMPLDNEISDNLSKKNAYVLSHTRTFFDIVEMSAPIEIDYKNLTVEHIMPQTPTEYWQKVCGVKDEEYAHLVNLIGNLTLADKGTNSRISNSDFATKKKELEKVGKINLSKDILASEIWDKRAILARNERLTALFIELFPYFSSKNNYEIKNSFPITFDVGETQASAIIYLDKSVELQPDSEVRFCETRDKQSQKMLERYLENGMVKKVADCYKTVKVISFASISAATNFVYGGTNNGWVCWKDEEGNSINDLVRPLIEETSNK